MLISPHPFELEFLDSTYKRQAEQQRSKGLHISDVIRDLMNRVLTPGKRGPVSSLDDEGRAQMGAYVEVGFSWERMLEREFEERMLVRRQYDASLQGHEVIRQGEYSLDGLFLTPDGLYVGGPELVDEEYKATWKSEKKLQTVAEFEHYFWEWNCQFKCYCRLFGIRRTRLFVFWVNGNYAPSKPKAMRYEIEYAEEEVESNWSMVVNHAGWMRDNGLAAA
jgi:hypothetical protein